MLPVQLAGPGGKSLIASFLESVQNEGSKQTEVAGDTHGDAALAADPDEEQLSSLEVYTIEPIGCERRYQPCVERIAHFRSPFRRPQPSVWIVIPQYDSTGHNLVLDEI